MNRLIVVIVALVVTIPAVFKSRPSGDHPTSTAYFVYPYSFSGTTIMIDGDVKHPGIYVLGANIVTVGAIVLAEPFQALEGLEKEGVGKQPLRNGSVVHVAEKADNSVAITVGEISTAQRILLGIPLDIHNMGRVDFEHLPGIGPVLADRIVKYRQMNGGVLRVEDLLSVSGIGDKKYNIIKKYF